MTKKKTSPFEDVQKFMIACGQTVYVENEDQRNLYWKLINEEWDELNEAYENKDDVETIDACFDLMWVIIGYMKSRGWDCDASWLEGAKSNLSKIDAETGKVLKRKDGKVMKPEGWAPPNFTPFVKKL